MSIVPENFFCIDNSGFIFDCMVIVRNNLGDFFTSAYGKVSMVCCFFLYVIFSYWYMKLYMGAVVMMFVTLG